MSDLDPSDPSDRRVDSLVGGFCAALAPTDSTALVRRVDDALTCAVSPRPTARRRAATGLAAVCVLALAIILLPLLQASHATPSTAVSSTPASATMTPASMPPRPTVRPAGGLEAELAAHVDQAGLIEGGGLWAIRGNWLLLSANGGATWVSRERTGDTMLGSVFALDTLHIWTITNPPTPGLADGPPRLVVSRSVDGGQTWANAEIKFDGMGACSWPSFAPSDVASFSDAQHGFIVHEPPCSQPHDVTILRTSDGGATWAVAGATEASVPLWTTPDAATIWMAPGPGQAFLRVSRDGGATWSDADLPGLEGQRTSAERFVSGLRFVDGSRGVVAVSSRQAKDNTLLSHRFFVTTDGGRTWTEAAAIATATAAPAIVDLEHWLVPTKAFTISATDDGGRSWREVAIHGPSSMPPPWSFTDPLHGCILVPLALPAVDTVLYVTADGGSTWEPAPFGAASPPEPASPDDDRVRASDFAFTLGDQLPDGDVGWGLLSDYSKARFGSEAAFRLAETAYHDRQVSTSVAAAETVLLDARTGPALGPIWTDLLATADTSRAYLVQLDHTDAAGHAGKERLVVAPLRDGGGLRIWIVSQD